MWRGLAIWAVIAVVSPMPAWGAKRARGVPFDWAAVSRYAGDVEGDGRLDDEAIAPRPRSVTLTQVDILPTRAYCAVGVTLRWRIDGRARSVQTVPSDAGLLRPCYARLTFSSLRRRRHRVAI